MQLFTWKGGSICHIFFCGNSYAFFCVLKSVFLDMTFSMLGSVVFNDVLGTPHQAKRTYQCPWISEVPEARHEARLRAACVSVTRIHWFAPPQIDWWFLTRQSTTWSEKFKFWTMFHMLATTNSSGSKQLQVTYKTKKTTVNGLFKKKNTISECGSFRKDSG